MPKKSETPFLHLYPQLDNHIEAWVVGNKAGLKALKKAITAALKDERLKGEQAFAADGEGYQVLVLPLTNEQIKTVRVPYTEMLEVNRSGLHPFHLVSRPDYIEAMTPKSKMKP